jgi:hypothetical protein
MITDNSIPKKKLSRRQALRIKRKKLQGRVNTLRSELSQLEPVLAKLEKRLEETNPEKQRQEST